MRSPLQLALAYQRGQGTAKDCTLAAKHLNTFLVERAPWHDDIYTAVETLDSGDPPMSQAGSTACGALCMEELYILGSLRPERLHCQ